MALLLAPGLCAQQTEPQQTPAPIVRPRPRPQTSVPVTAPPDAAPLVNRAPRPRPINPQDLVGSPAASGQTVTGVTRPRVPATGAVPNSTAPARTPGATAASGQTATTPRPARPATSQSATGTTTAPTAGAPAGRSSLSATGLNRTVIVLDPAHGGADGGSRIGDNLQEKEVTLGLAFRLRSLLIARGFTVVLTRDNDSGLASNSTSTPLTLDDRAGIANHARAAACLFLHATGRGNGLHLYTSELQPAPGEATQLPWLTAQAAWIPASEQLERSLSTALGRSHIALVSSTASVRPLDSLTCPAMVVELAPEGGDPKSVNDAGYQDRIAAAVAGALVFWQNQVQPPPKLTLAAPASRTSRRRTPATTTPSPSERQP